MTGRSTTPAPLLAAVAFALCACGDPRTAAAPAAPLVPDSTPNMVVANDNRSPAGTLRGGVLELRLEARLARWELEDSVVTVLAFAEEGSAATIPGPLLRVPAGAEVRVSVRNSIPESMRIGLPPPGRRGEGMSSIANPVLIVHGLRAGTGPDDTLHIAPGQVREVRYRAGAPGTYLYRGAASDRPITGWTGRDAQLAGAIVVDPPGAEPHPDERIFVVTMIDVLPDSAQPPPYDDIFRRAINGASWPRTERLRYDVGDTVRWRWVNASGLEHPMHLHGFHYRVLAKGDGATDTTYAPDRVRLAVTEHMEPGSTFRMEWVPERAGNWIFHCHILPHVEPVPARPAEARAHDGHDVARHALEAMGGLVLGISVSDAGAVAAAPPPQRRLRLVAQQRDVGGDQVVRAFVLQEGAEARPDSVAVPGPPLILTRGQTTAITVVNRLREPTTVHWHGMELESVYDGVAGWSRTGSNVAPLIAPGDSFTVHMTPPRAGTFIYHTHMDESEQLVTGMYGPLLVLEPGERFDPAVDRVFVIGQAVDGGSPEVTINGRREPETVTLRAGREYRLRIINITDGATVDVALERDSVPLRWSSLAKDGADLPPALRVEQAARLRLDPGETYDFRWTPAAPGEAMLLVRTMFVTDPGEFLVRQSLRVR